MPDFPIASVRSPLAPEEALRRLSRLPGSACLRDGRTGWVLATAIPHEEVVVRAPEDPLEAIRAMEADDRGFGPGDPGWIGFFTYEAGRAIERLPQRIPEPQDPPRLHLARYRSAHWWHPERGSYLEGEADHARLIGEALDSPLGEEETSRLSGRALGTPTLDLGPSAYRQAFATVAEAISKGEVYQVNLTSLLRGRWRGHPLAFHEQLVREPTPPWASYLDLGDMVVSSASPELLLAYDAASRLARSEPIKGTAPRAADSAEDSRLAAALSQSLKDRAEHVMIVDLVRNDLGRVCLPGTIVAEPLMRPMKLAHVHHLATEVRGRLQEGRSLVDLLCALYPGGSITGAPKVAAMKIIDSLEPAPRGVYCGAIGRISPAGDAAFSLPIRTATLKTLGDGTWAVEYGAGGGLVQDSRADDEYEELLLKARAVTQVLTGE